MLSLLVLSASVPPISTSSLARYETTGALQKLVQVSVGQNKLLSRLQIYKRVENRMEIGECGIGQGAKECGTRW